MSIRKFACVAALACLLPFVEARAYEWHDSIEYKAEVGTTLSGGAHTPFWLQSNKYGFSGLERNNLWLRVGAFKHIDEAPRFSWGAGVDLGVAHRMQSTFIPQQLYAEVRYRCLDAMIGAKELSDGFLDQSLSSGSLTQGWNARPLPQVRIGIFDYADVWGCKEMFAVKGHIAYGMFDDDWWLKRWANPDYRYSLNTLYCSRAIYFRGGNAKKFPLEGELGLVMDTQFGGKTWIPAEGNREGYWEKHPTYLKAWAKAFIPTAGGTDTAPGEQTNVEGNFLGNWSMSLKWQDPSGWMVRLYYQHFFEDHSMLFFDYPWKDGLYGVQGKLPANPFVSDILYEFFYSKDQAGPCYWDHTSVIDYQISARDSYYNHYIYNGWQNWGQAIGSPLFISPVYNDNHRLHFLHNRLISHHFGIKGTPSRQTDYRLLVTWMRSWGSYTLPLPHPEENFSWLAQVNWHPQSLPGWNASVSLGMDHGKLLGNSFGVQLAISKTGWIK